MKSFKRILIGLLCLVLITELMLLVTGNWYVNRVLGMTVFSGKMSPDIDEVGLFPMRELETGKPQPWVVSSQFNRQALPANVVEQMVGYQTVAFLVIRHDSLLHETYWENFDKKSVANSFSMAKSINAILIGCALREGLIKTLDQPVGDFIESFSTGDKSGITIRHLLTMSSGLDFKEEYVSPFAWPAEAYYGDDVNALTLRAGVKKKAGKEWEYKGGDSQLLGMILKKATGRNVADYAAEKLWKRIGAEEKAFWSLDKKDGMEKVSCCFYTNARDYARLAKLYMNSGNWGGTQLVDSDYVKASITPVGIADKNGKPTMQYGYQWWLMKHKGHDIFYMRGIRGQYVFAIPDLDMIVVRLGHKRAPKVGDELPADIYLYLDAALALAGTGAGG